MSEKSPQYTVLARRFRPQSFDEVVGQEHVGQAIKNAIQSERVAHAYLFTGARGVGKTSTARIFAKALNCPNLQDGVPCNQCDVCDSIGAGSDVDVLEIDGASNRGIDDIRQLRANVNVRSMRSPYKVYIIDEVHMLTKEAFNALLKTLEEPPPNVKFVFCTTEPNKLPDTILSRCQRFDFGTIAQHSIVGRLNQIAEAEGKQVELEAVELVARRAAGSMRDSQSLFDQLLAFGGEQITAADVHRLLGTAPDERLIDLVNALMERRQADALLLLDTAMLEGVQLGAFSDQLLAYFRDLLVTSAGADTVTLSAVANSSREVLKQQAETWGVQTVSAAMQILAETKARMQRVNYGRALVELAIVRISLLEDLESIVGLVKQVQSGQAPTVAVPARPARVSGPANQVKKNDSPPVATSTQPSPTAGPAPSVQAPEPSPQATAQSKPAPGPPKTSPPASEKPEPTPGPPQTSPSPGSMPSVQEVTPASNHSPTPEPTPEPAPQVAAEITPSEPPPQPIEAEKPAPVQQVVELTNDTLKSFWANLMSELPGGLTGHLKNSTRQRIVGPNLLQIVFPKSYLFSKSYLERPETLKKLCELTSQTLGAKVSCTFDVDEAAIQKPKPTSQKKPEPERRKVSLVEEDELVQQAVRIFSGQVVEVRPVYTKEHSETDDD